MVGCLSQAGMHTPAALRDFPPPTPSGSSFFLGPSLNSGGGGASSSAACTQPASPLDPFALYVLCTGEAWVSASYWQHAGTLTCVGFCCTCMFGTWAWFGISVGGTSHIVDCLSCITVRRRVMGWAWGFTICERSCFVTGGCFSCFQPPDHQIHSARVSVPTLSTLGLPDSL